MAHAFLTGPRPPAIRLVFCSKVPYSTRGEAHRHRNLLRQANAGELKAIGSGALGVYHCGRCAAWHVGHRKRKGER